MGQKCVLIDCHFASSVLSINEGNGWHRFTDMHMTCMRICKDAVGQGSMLADLKGHEQQVHEWVHGKNAVRGRTGWKEGFVGLVDGLAPRFGCLDAHHRIVWVSEARLWLVHFRVNFGQTKSEQFCEAVVALPSRSGMTEACMFLEFARGMHGDLC